MDKKKFPQHIALIMDGNRRWARARELSIFQGHEEGEKRIEPLVDAAMEMGISYLTFWAFSTENWKRTKKEVSFLLNLYRKELDKKVDNFHRKNVKVNVIGNLSMFPPDIGKKTRHWMEKTKRNTKITVNFALSYGGRDEIIRAVNKIVKEVKKGEWARKKVNQETFSYYLDTAGQPDPDLIIRTGGEMRLSGYLPWQSVYSELYFTKVFWPDFTPKELEKAIVEYQRRQRRFGK